jgi:hypothetical protein
MRVIVPLQPKLMCVKHTLVQTGLNSKRIREICVSVQIQTDN